MTNSIDLVDKPVFQDNASLPPPHVLAAIDQVVAYLWDEEERHAEEVAGDEVSSTEPHVFDALRLIRHWRLKSPRLPEANQDDCGS